MAAAVAALQAAVEADDALRAQAGDEDAAQRPEAISLRQRAWPLVEMIRRAQAADPPITWGV